MVTIRKNKVKLMFNKPGYIGICAGIKSSIDVRIPIWLY